MTKTVTAYEARTNLGELLNEVYYKGDEIIIKKSGKPVAKITRVATIVSNRVKPKKDLYSLAGIWAGADGKTISSFSKRMRENFKLLQ